MGERIVRTAICDGCGKDDDGTFVAAQYEKEHDAWSALLCLECRRPVEELFHRGTDLIPKNSFEALYREIEERGEKPRV